MKEGVVSKEINHTEHIFNKSALDSFTREAYKYVDKHKYLEMKEKRNNAKLGQ